MRETRSSGSVEGAMGNHDSYSDFRCLASKFFYPLERPIAGDIFTRLNGRRDARYSVKIAHIVGQVRIVCNPLLVALEKREICDVEADQRREQSPIGFRDLS